MATRRTVLALSLVAGSALVTACGGALAPEPLDEGGPSEAAGTSRSSQPRRSDGPSETAPSPSAAAPEAAPPGANLSMPPGKDMPTTGACAARSAASGKVGGGGGVRCTVSNASTEAGTGFVSIGKVDGDRGDATMTDDTLLLRCATADAMLFQAAIRCFQGSGNYQVAPGDLVLGGESSDRSCRILVDLDETSVRGFLECPNEPEDPDNVFASSAAPIGLGAFDLARAF